MNHWKIRCVSILTLVALSGWPASEAVASPSTDIVEALHDTLISVMKQAGTLGYAGRAEQIGPILDDTFDLGFMASKTVGRHWKKLSPADQERWQKKFHEVTVANYAGRFDGFSDQRFETLGEEPAAHDTIVVRTVLVLPEREDVHLNYRLRETPAGWRIVDVYLNGTVSELALRRSEYSAVLKREGFDKLISIVDEKVRNLAAGEAD